MVLIMCQEAHAEPTRAGLGDPGTPTLSSAQTLREWPDVMGAPGHDPLTPYLLLTWEAGRV